MRAANLTVKTERRKACVLYTAPPAVAPRSSASLDPLPSAAAGVAAAARAPTEAWVGAVLRCCSALGVLGIQGDAAAKANAHCLCAEDILAVCTAGVDSDEWSTVARQWAGAPAFSVLAAVLLQHTASAAAAPNAKAAAHALAARMSRTPAWRRAGGAVLEDPVLPLPSVPAARPPFAVGAAAQTPSSVRARSRRGLPSGAVGAARHLSVARAAAAAAADLGGRPEPTQRARAQR